MASGKRKGRKEEGVRERRGGQDKRGGKQVRGRVNWGPGNQQSASIGTKR